MTIDIIHNRTAKEERENRDCVWEMGEVEGKTSEFGHGMKELWALDDSYVNMNHGSYGATPREVTAAAIKYREEVERNPDAVRGREQT